MTERAGEVQSTPPDIKIRPVSNVSNTREACPRRKFLGVVAPALLITLVAISCREGNTDNQHENTPYNPDSTQTIIPYKLLEDGSKIDLECEFFVDRLTIKVPEAALDEDGQLKDQELLEIIDNFDANPIDTEIDIGFGYITIGAETGNIPPLFDAFQEKIDTGEIISVERVPTVTLPEVTKEDCQKLPSRP